MTERIHGVVVDAHGGPVPGARVALGAGPVPMPDVALLTEDDGTFWLDVPAPGEYAVTAHTDVGSAKVRVRVPEDGEVELRLS